MCWANIAYKCAFFYIIQNPDSHFFTPYAFIFIFHQSSARFVWMKKIVIRWNANQCLTMKANIFFIVELGRLLRDWGKNYSILSCVFIVTWTDFIDFSRKKPHARKTKRERERGDRRRRKEKIFHAFWKLFFFSLFSLSFIFLISTLCVLCVWRQQSIVWSSVRVSKKK
jgi:hypothetical protein